MSTNMYVASARQIWGEQQRLVTQYGQSHRNLMRVVEEFFMALKDDEAVNVILARALPQGHPAIETIRSFK